MFPCSCQKSVPSLVKNEQCLDTSFIGFLQKKVDHQTSCFPSLPCMCALGVMPLERVKVTNNSFRKTAFIGFKPLSREQEPRGTLLTTLAEGKSGATGRPKPHDQQQKQVEQWHN